MGLLNLVGDVEIRQRRARYPGEPSHKRLSFVRPKHTTTTDTWEVVAPLQPLTYQVPPPQFQNHPQWQYLSLEQRRIILERYYQTGIPPRFNAPVQIHQQPRIQQHPQHTLTPPHLRPQRRLEPSFEVIEPAHGKHRKRREPKIDRGHGIFESDSDSDARSSYSTRTTYYVSSSDKSTRSSSSKSSSLRPVQGWR